MAKKPDSQMDLFVMDMVNVASKDDQYSMEHPIFTLSKRKDMKDFEYQRGDVSYKIIPSGHGRANIYDKDILIFCATQIVAAINQGEQVSRKVEMPVYSFLKTTHSSTGGRAYDEVEKKLIRLKGTQITWRDGAPGKAPVRKGVGLIEDYTIIERDNSGKLGTVQITLSEWFFDTVRELNILTIHQDYFLTSKADHKRLYEIFRKHCGHKESFAMKFDTLCEKMPKRDQAKRKFKMNLIQEGNVLIGEYIIFYDERDHKVVCLLDRDKATNQIKSIQA